MHALVYHHHAVNALLPTSYICLSHSFNGRLLSWVSRTIGNSLHMHACIEQMAKWKLCQSTRTHESGQKEHTEQTIVFWCDRYAHSERQTVRRTHTKVMVERWRMNASWHAHTTRVTSMRRRILDVYACVCWKWNNFYVIAYAVVVVGWYSKM